MKLYPFDLRLKFGLAALRKRIRARVVGLLFIGPIRKYWYRKFWRDTERMSPVVLLKLLEHAPVPDGLYQGVKHRCEQEGTLSGRRWLARGYMRHYLKLPDGPISDADADAFIRQHPDGWRDETFMLPQNGLKKWPSAKSFPQ